MAEKLEEFPLGIRQTSYPWDEWRDGSIWRIVFGDDFQSDPKNMTSMLYARARADGLKVRVQRETDKSLVFQFYEA